MKRLILSAALAALVLPIPALAVDIDFVPDVTTVGLGETVQVDIVASGLVAMGSQSLGAFDLTVTYDDAIFSYSGLDFGSELGDPGLLESLVTITPGAGTVRATQVSLILPSALVSAQPDTFVVATVSFQADALGDGNFDLLGGTILSDELGNPLTLDLVVPATVTVDAGLPAVEVPTASEWGLLVLLLALGWSAISRLGRGSGALPSVLIGVVLLGLASSAPVHAVDGDLDMDGDVDLLDVQAIHAALDQVVAGGDPKDLDDDGTITVLDVRLAVACCNLAGCAVVDNAPPTITAIADQAIDEDATTGALAFTVGDDQLAPGALTVTAASSDTGLIPDANLSLGGAGAARTVDVMPVADASGGPVTITVTVDDGVHTADASFTVTVSAVNDAPSFTAGGDQTVAEDAGAQAVAAWATGISAGPTDEAGQMVSFAVTGNTNAALFAAGPAIDASGELTYTPVADANGSATVTITLSDDGGGADTSAAQSFDITVTAVNDPPSFTAGADQSVLEDAGAQTVAAWATGISVGPADEAGQMVTFAVTGNTNSALFAAGPAIDASGELTYTPAADANGSAMVTVALSDDGGGTDTSPAQTFEITIDPVNDVPTFTAGSNISVNLNTSPLAQSFANWATGISAGVGEGSQTLTFAVTGNTDTGLFTVQPAIDASGTLTFTAAFAANGTATITIELMDDGGTDDGGVDTSASQTFEIELFSPG